MIESFITATKKRESRVQQMIMGAGKTTVISPLLTLILANSEQMVLHVMPSALLDMSRNVLRRSFSCLLIPKRVYTLSFDRSIEDSAEVADRLHAKVDTVEFPPLTAHLNIALSAPCCDGRKGGRLRNSRGSEVADAQIC